MRSLLLAALLLFTDQSHDMNARQLSHKDVDDKRYDVMEYFNTPTSFILYNDGSSPFGQHGNESQLQFGPIAVSPHRTVKISGRYRINPGTEGKLFVRFVQEDDTRQIEATDGKSRLDKVGEWTYFDRKFMVAPHAKFILPTFELVPDNNYQEPWIGDVEIRSLRFSVIN